MKDRVQVFDTTLRDGEQSPGASMTIQDKLMLAHQLERLRVDVIEAGFPISSEGDFESVRRIAKEILQGHDHERSVCVNDQTGHNRAFNAPIGALLAQLRDDPLGYAAQIHGSPSHHPTTHA